MASIVIMGSQGSGKKELQKKISFLLQGCQLEVCDSKISSSFDAGILVISVPDGPGPQTKELLLMAKEAHIPIIFCFLNKEDLVTGRDRRDMGYLVETECRELAKKYGYSQNNFFVVVGSALKETRIQQLVKLIQDKIKISQNPSIYQCRKCGHIESMPFEICKACNEKQKISFLDKLFKRS